MSALDRAAQLALAEQLMLFGRPAVARAAQAPAAPAAPTIVDRSRGDRPAITLRPYQAAAVDAALRELARVRATLVVIPTGGGKTIVFAAVGERWRASGGGRVLVLAHREELLHQARQKLARATKLSTGLEQAASRVLRSALPDVVVASVQTLGKRRLATFAPTDFGLVIIDEAHHAPAPSYRAVLDYFAAAKVLGVTATPDRADDKALVRAA